MYLLRTLITIIMLQMISIACLAQTGSEWYPALKPGFTDVPDKKWEKKRINAWLTDTAGNIFQGQLFLVTDSSLVFFASDTSFYHFPDTSRLGYFHKNEIDRLVLKRDWKFVGPLIVGVWAPLIPMALLLAEINADNTNETVLWALILGPVIYVASATITVPASLLFGSLWWVDIDHTFGPGDWQELHAHLKKYALADADNLPLKTDFLSMHITSNDSLIPKQAKQLFDQMEYARLCITGGIDFGYSTVHDQFKDYLVHALPALSYYEQQVEPQLSFGLAGRIAPNWSIHAGGQNTAGFVQFDYPAEVNESSGWYDFSYDITRFYLGGSYIINPVRRLMAHRSQYTLSAGLFTSVMSTWIYAGLPTSIDNYEHPRYEYDLEDTFSEGMYLQADYDAFFLKFLSLGATMRYNHGNGLIINDLKWVERGGSAPASIRPVKLDNSSLYVGLRAKFHFF